MMSTRDPMEKKLLLFGMMREKNTMSLIQNVVCSHYLWFVIDLSF